jgi:hypothetical protein
MLQVNAREIRLWRRQRFVTSGPVIRLLSIAHTEAPFKEDLRMDRPLIFFPLLALVSITLATVYTAAILANAG